MRKQRLLAVACASAFLWAGCQEPGRPAPTYTPSSGSLALSRDDQLVYAVDTDSGVLAVVSTQERRKVAEVKVGVSPERVVVGPDDTVYVANRGDRSVSVIRRGAWVEAARIAVGVEPSGLAVSPDGRTLYVVNATTLEDASVGSLQAVDTASLQTRWEVPVGEEPRGLALLPDGKAAVSLSRQGTVVRVDLDETRVLPNAGDGIYAQANRGLLSSDSRGGREPLAGPPGMFRPRGMTDVVASPDGQRLYVPTVWASEGVLGASQSSSGGGAAYGGGPCNQGGVASPGIVTLQAHDGQALVDDITRCGGEVDLERDYPPTLVTTPGDGLPVQGPAVGVVDPTGTWLFVVNRETNNVAVVPTTRGPRTAPSSPPGGVSGGSTHSVVPVGAGPNGIALTRDGRTAFVYSQFDHTLHVLGGVAGTVRQVAEPLKLAEDVLGAEVVAGRKLFFSATDHRMNGATVAVSCASCHPDGREDGHVWRFAEGPRQTPSLAGRRVTQTAPFHWNGEFRTFSDFLQHTVSLRMGGSGVTGTMAAQLAAFVESLPAPDNPHRREQLSPLEQHGKDVFHKAGCDTCHVGDALTNNTFADVGTLVRSGPVVDDPQRLPQRGLNTPSLLALARTAPYLHDGSAADLKARILQGKERNQHGATAQLSDGEVDALVAYLKTL
jgi:YVTN family beta-propeller protein